MSSGMLSAPSGAVKRGRVRPTVEGADRERWRAGGDGRWPTAAAAGGLVREARREQRREMRREAILEAAAPLFVRRGVAATSLDHIASSLGLTRPALYHYFRDKNQILIAIVERAFANLIREATDIVRSDRSSVEKLERIFTLHTTRVAADPQAIFLIVTQAGELSSPARAALRRRQRRYESILVRLVEQGIADGEIAPCNASLLVKAMVSLANWVYAWYDPGGPYRPEDVAAFLWSLLRGGLGSPLVTAATDAAEDPRSRRPRRAARQTA
ncbi:MAG: TetR/AcrR family transcriptional regulator [Chloroflexi bacterium]|nr:MAG: TetR/AcrR family transcriptional regulator [Chloroflexota bacterium]